MFSNIPTPDSLTGSLIQKPASGNSLCMEPIVSVVTVCLNPIRDGRKDLFEKNLDSVQQQRDVAVEHIIVDGASDDGTLDFLRQYKNQSHDIRLLSMPDTGIYEAMNRGIALSRGKYVIFLNSDDYYHRADGLALSVKALEENNCGYTFAPISPVGPHTRHSPHRNPQKRIHKFFVFCTLPHPSMMFRRDTLLEVDGYDQNYRLAADYDMMLRIIAAGHKVCFVNSNFVTFLASGFSAKNKELNNKEKVRIIKNFHKEALGVELSEEESAYIVHKCKYPRKYLQVYVRSQQLISETFLAIPQGVFYKISRRFNYVKYYLKCLLSS